MSWRCKCGAWVADDVPYHQHVIDRDEHPPIGDRMRTTVTVETVRKRDAVERK